MNSKNLLPKHIVIVDCYTDEPAGLGVPPYLGTYPRYIFGACKKHSIEPKYLTIDDLRFCYEYGFDKKETSPRANQKTNIKIYNQTRNVYDTKQLLEEADLIIVISGIHTPGKYLSAHPGTTTEVLKYLRDKKGTKLLCGPAGGEHDSTHEGGKVTRNVKQEFDIVIEKDIELYLDQHLSHEQADDRLRTYEELRRYAKYGAPILHQITEKEPVIEIELGRGCPRTKGCSFCTEWTRFRDTVWRNQEDIVEEMKAYYDEGARHFRLGRQSCFYSYKFNRSKEVEKLFSMIWDACPKIKTLHIDNANPPMVISKEGERITQLICKYCTPGNIAAMGVESFDPVVQEKNTLNTNNEMTLKAVAQINKYGAKDNIFLPGINIIFGLDGESKKTHEWNMEYLTEILKNYKIRRINVRTVAPLPGTDLYEQCKDRFIRKNRRLYWRWRDDIRQKIDHPMLEKLYPKGTLMKGVLIKVWDGKNSFGHQAGTYPIICGVSSKRLEIGRSYDLCVTGHNKRSLVCTLVHGPS